MARKKGRNVKASFDVSGKSIEELLQVDVNKLSEADLRKVSSRLVSASNKRIRGLRKVEPKSGKQYLEYSASKEYIDKVGKFSTLTKDGKRKNRNQLLNEFTKMKTFIESKTSSVTGLKELKKDVEKRLGTKLTFEQQDTLFKTYKRIESEGAGVLGKLPPSQQLQLEIAEMVKGKTFDEAMEFANTLLDDLYEGADIEEDDVFALVGDNDVFDDEEDL